MWELVKLVTTAHTQLKPWKIWKGPARGEEVELTETQDVNCSIYLMALWSVFIFLCK